MSDERVSVRYMDDDIHQAVDLYSGTFGFEFGHDAGVRRPDQLCRATEAGRTKARTRRLERHPFRWRRHRRQGRPPQYRGVGFRDEIVSVKSSNIGVYATKSARFAGCRHEC